MVQALRLIVLVLSSFPAITNGYFQSKSTEPVWIGDEIVVADRRLVSSKSSKSSPTGNARKRNRQREHSKSGYDEKNKSKFLSFDSRKSDDRSSDGGSSNLKGESKSEASQKGTDDSDKSRSKRDDRDGSSRNVARSSSESASRPRSDKKRQSRSRSNNHKSRSSDKKRSNGTGNSKSKKKRSRSDPGDIFTPRGSTSADSTPAPTPEDSLSSPTLEPDTGGMTCDAKMRKCGRERRPIYALDLKD